MRYENNNIKEGQNSENNIKSKGNPFVEAACSSLFFRMNLRALRMVFIVGGIFAFLSGLILRFFSVN